MTTFEGKCYYCHNMCTAREETGSGGMEHRYVCGLCFDGVKREPGTFDGYWLIYVDNHSTIHYR